MAIEWLSDLIPFLSGAAGIGIAYGAMKQALATEKEARLKIEDKLGCQVGEERCERIREQCRETMKETLADIKVEIIANRNWVTDRFTEIARFMGQHNGK